MHVILNSDVLYGDYIRWGVPKEVCQLIAACDRADHTLVIPRTALLEVERDQKKRRDKAVDEIGAAIGTLDDYDIPHEDISPQSVVPIPDLQQLYTDLSERVEIVDATLEDFRDAHDRACLHDPPHPPDIKSDEMRDLVIWAIALRVARGKGRALLVSRDVVHTHHRGDDEANAAELVRVSSIEDALGYLDVETPGGELLKSLIAPSWQLLRDAGLPLGRAVSIRGITNVTFIQGRHGPSEALGRLKIQGVEGVTVMADAHVVVEPVSARRLALTSVVIDDKPQDPVVVDVMYSGLDDDIEERFEFLNEALGAN